MKAIVSKVIAAFVAFGLAVAVVFYVRALRAERATAQQEASDAKQGVADRDGVIARLRQDAKNKARQQQKLDQDRTGIAARWAAIQSENRKLHDENEAYRAWADAPLPDDIVRMQSSTALTGASDYLAGMSAGDTVHDASGVTAH
ncbi:phage lysis regulatory protein, LysB family [Burkholderia sp. D7]|nr:phage lysis regulatory protein, LysB family [Burkholderia sp. D7]